jgi:hypothetical protein
MENPDEGLEMIGASGKRQSHSDIVAIRVKGPVAKIAHVVGVVVGVVANDQEEMPAEILGQGKMPVELRPLSAAIVSDKLGMKKGCPGQKESIVKPEIPAVDRAAEVVVTREIGGMLNLREKLAVKAQLVLGRQVLRAVEAAEDVELVAGKADREE